MADKSERRALKIGLSNFTMGTILGKGFAQAQVHTNHSNHDFDLLFTTIGK